MASPYFIAVDPSPVKLRLFFGRRREIQVIAEYLRKGDSVLLIGERRMGKTFLLYMIGDFARRGADFYKDLLDRQTGTLLADLHRSTTSFYWAFVDMLSITNAAGFYFKVLAELAGEQIGRFTTLSPMNHLTFTSELTKLSQDLSRRGQRAVVLVDESEKLLNLDRSADIFSCLKAIVQQCDAVSFLLAGDIKPHQLTPEFVNLKGALRLMHLGPLDSVDAQALVQIPTEGYLSFEDPALKRILELTGGNPSLIQILCGHLYELVTSKDSKAQITLAHFDHLWESDLRDKVFESFDAALWDFFEGLQGDEHDVFCFLAHNPGATVDDIAKALGIQSAFVRRGCHKLQKAHKIEETVSGLRISAGIVAEFGSRFVACPVVRRPQLPPVTVAQNGRPESVLMTNLKHHAQGVTALVEQWKGVKTQEEIESWLLMFEDDERSLAIKLLGNTKYYSKKQIDKFCEILHSKFIRAIGHSLKLVWFFGMGGPSKSGQMLLYPYRAVNALSASHFQDISKLRAFSAKGIRVLAFIDDFIGTGNQITTFWHEELKGQRGIEKADLYCLVLFAFQSGIERVQTQTPFKVICVESLDERDCVFSHECSIFTDDEERRRAEEICRRHGEVLCPQHPLGYDDSQALIAFEYQTPNNSLPVLWSNKKGWIPIFERKA